LHDLTELARFPRSFIQVRERENTQAAVGDLQLTRGRLEEDQILRFPHVGALETGDDGDVDVVFADSVDETLRNGVAAHDAA
jgi:hypothetical protein